MVTLGLGGSIVDSVKFIKNKIEKLSLRHDVSIESGFCSRDVACKLEDVCKGPVTQPSAS